MLRASNPFRNFAAEPIRDGKLHPFLLKGRQPIVHKVARATNLAGCSEKNRILRVKRHPVTRSEIPAARDARTPESILPTLDRLATAEGLPTLIELASGGRADTALRACLGPTWTNIAQRSIHLLSAVLSDLGTRAPPEQLRRIKDLKAIGVNWVYGRDDSPAGHALFNYGTFEFDTSELRNAASELLQQRGSTGLGPKLTNRLRPVEAGEPAATAHPDEPPLQLDGVIQEQQQAVRLDPTAVEPYRALYKLYVHREQIDRAWCASQALSLLGKANDDERQFFEGFRPKGPLAVKNRLDSALWKSLLYHPDESRDISHIFDVLAPAALKLKLHQLRASNQLSVMDERFKQDPKGSTLPLAKTFGWAAEVFGIRCPELYVRSDLPGALVAVPMRPPASLGGSTVLSGLQPQELTFIVGKHMSFYRGEHYVKCIFSDPAELEALFFAALKLVGVEAPAPWDLSEQVKALADPLAKCMEQDRLGELRQAVHRWVKSATPPDIRWWGQAVELTACRAGLLLSGDLGAAWSMINAEPEAGDLPAEEKLKELFVFSVSAEYFALREVLGITIG